jgi:hypothetical protein
MLFDILLTEQNSKFYALRRDMFLGVRVWRKAEVRSKKLLRYPGMSGVLFTSASAF